jgi:transcriptional regulator with XRE-family HTH domain
VRYTLVSRKEGLDIYKTMEEIRKAAGMNQTDFANALGISRRTYAFRLIGDQPWLLHEVVKAAELNEGEVAIETEGRVLNISIK